MYNNHYFMMQGYGFASYSILVILAHILMLVSFTGFIFSMVMYFIKKSSLSGNNQKKVYNTFDIPKSACSICGFTMQTEWQCCPKCGNDDSKHETPAEQTDIVEFATPIKENLESIQINAEEAAAPVIEVQIEEQDHAESGELNDVVERIYQDNKEEYKKNSKKVKKNSKPS